VVETGAQSARAQQSPGNDDGIGVWHSRDQARPMSRYSCEPARSRFQRGLPTVRCRSNNCGYPSCAYPEQVSAPLVQVAFALDITTGSAPIRCRKWWIPLNVRGIWTGTGGRFLPWHGCIIHGTMVL